MENQKNQLISILGEPNYDLLPISYEAILKTDLLDYNKSEGLQTLKRYNNYGAKYFLAPKDSIYNYDRLFVHYTIEGLQMFRSLSLFHSCIHNGGFKTVSIFDTENFVLVYIQGFGPKFENYAENCKKNRMKFIASNTIVTDL